MTCHVTTGTLRESRTGTGASGQRQRGTLQSGLAISSAGLNLNLDRSQISRLVEDVQRLQANLSRLREASAAQIHSLEQHLAEKSEALGEVERRLALQSDYEEMKRELE